MNVSPPDSPAIHFVVGITGHRGTNVAIAVVHEIEEIVVSENESWQAVFSGKHIALPA